MVRRVRLVVVFVVGLSAIAGAWLYRSHELGKLTGRWIGAYTGAEANTAPVGRYDMAIEIREDGSYFDYSDNSLGHWKSISNGLRLTADSFNGMTRADAEKRWSKKHPISKLHQLVIDHIFTPRVFRARGSYLCEVDIDAGSAIWYRRN